MKTGNAPKNRRVTCPLWSSVRSRMINELYALLARSERRDFFIGNAQMPSGCMKTNTAPNFIGDPSSKGGCHSAWPFSNESKDF